mmetsp:Transcript_26805/g.45228  ORF Transcript_26805/g.45228 Transcript_26805/m.45228 type:complete len:232 (+) Transcript_26805:8-703(+)
MRGGASKKNPRPEELAEEMKHDDMKQIMNSLLLTEDDIAMFWRAFCAIDVSNNRELSSEEFEKYYKFEGEAKRIFYVRLIFTREVKNNERYVNFRDFVTRTWDYLSQDVNRFIFTLYDKDCTETLSEEESHEIAMALYGVKFGTNKHLDKQLSDIDAKHGDGDGKISYAEFCKFTESHSNTNREGYYVQDQMRRHIGGLSYWKKQTAARAEKHGIKTFHQLYLRDSAKISN